MTESLEFVLTLDDCIISISITLIVAMVNLIMKLFHVSFRVFDRILYLFLERPKFHLWFVVLFIVDEYRTRVAAARAFLYHIFIICLTLSFFVPIWAHIVRVGTNIVVVVY